MKIYLCKATPTDKQYCVVSRHLSPLSAPLLSGAPVAPVMERIGATRVEFEIDEDRGGLVLPDLVGARLNYLIISATAIKELSNLELGPHELVPAALFNKKKRLHAEGYGVLNPLGQVDCLDPSRSDLDDDGDGRIFVKLFGKYALKANAIPADRHVFRVKGLAVGYMFSERAVEVIRNRNLTNFEFTDVPVS
jgi:hypothetical protein